MAGADSHSDVVQYGGSVVRMHSLDVEADNAGGVFWLYKHDP